MTEITCSNISEIVWLDKLQIISNNNIHVHYFNVESIHFIQSFYYLLNDDEKNKAGRYIQLSDKNLFMLGRIATKLLLSFYNNCSASEIDILKNKNNKPYANNLQELKFNISHSGNVLLIAVCKNEIGIDVEFVNKTFDNDVLHHSFTPNEISYIINSKDSGVAFTHIWTRKEAFLKAIGVGLINDLNQLEVLDKRNEYKSANDDFYEMYTFKLTDQYIGSICSKIDNNREILFFRPNLSAFK